MFIAPQAFDILPLNCRVRIMGPEPPLIGRIKRINIGDTGVNYEVVWWIGDQRYERWLYASEVVPDEDFIPIRIACGPLAA